MTLTATRQSTYDLNELAAARRLADWRFEQFEGAIADSVAEIGPGIGTFSERLLAGGAERLLLVEPEPEFHGVLELRFGGDDRVTLVPEALPDSPTLSDHRAALGFVLCQNVLEHIEDDRAALRAMADALRPGGALTVLVPGNPRLYGSLDRAYGHFRRYTPDRLRALAIESGLEVVDLYWFNLLGVPGWWLKSRRGAMELGPRSLAAYEVLLAGWRPVERRWRPPWGLSLILHARRSS